MLYEFMQGIHSEIEWPFFVPEIFQFCSLHRGNVLLQIYPTAECKTGQSGTVHNEFSIKNCIGPIFFFVFINLQNIESVF